MEATRQYGRHDLIEAYLATLSERYGGYYSGSSTFNAALRAHHEAMLDGLEQLFEFRLAPAAGAGALFTLFRSTARSMLAITTPWSGFLEAGLLHRKLDEAGDVGARVMAASDRIWARAEESRQDHRDILDALLAHFLGSRATHQFTADDLRALGVDVQPPDPMAFELDDD